MQYNNSTIIDVIFDYIASNNLEAHLCKKVMYKDKYSYKASYPRFYDPDWILLEDDGSDDYHIRKIIDAYDVTRTYKVKNTFRKLILNVDEYTCYEDKKPSTDYSFKPADLYYLKADMEKNPNLIDMVCSVCNINIKELLTERLESLNEEIDLLDMERKELIMALQEINSSDHEQILEQNTSISTNQSFHNNPNYNKIQSLQSIKSMLNKLSDYEIALLRDISFNNLHDIDINEFMNMSSEEKLAILSSQAQQKNTTNDNRPKVSLVKRPINNIDTNKLRK